MRQSTDEVVNGAVFNGFDYNLQVWVRDGIVTSVGLNADMYHGKDILTIANREERN